MSKINNAVSVLFSYSNFINEKYSELLKILILQKEDILQENMENLVVHIEEEKKAIALIKSFTSVVETYLNKGISDKEISFILKEINNKKKIVEVLYNDNIKMLQIKMSKLKKKIDSVRLPIRVKRVYNSGRKSELMDLMI